ncbi:MAG TPA: hypothetical protein VHC90_03980 [Bryobacteraceae bacterium]|nr:hypothetical protein [Bryobacteraceae bacterium]
MRTSSPLRVLAIAPLLLICSRQPAFAQWTSAGCSPSGSYCLTGGNAGIGTSSPAAPLHVSGTMNSGPVVKVESTAGTSHTILSIQNDTDLSGPHVLDFLVSTGGALSWFRNNGLNWEASTHTGLHLNGDPYDTLTSGIVFDTINPQRAASGETQFVLMNGNYSPVSGTGVWKALSLTPTINQTGGANGNTFGLYINPTVTSAANWTSLEVTNGSSVFLGNVGVGTAAPCTANAPTGCVMSVNGAIQAKEVVVNTGWSDYVFDPKYSLTPLSEIASFIEKNHHLPDIPSAAEVADKGVSVGEIQSKLLAKIEELTLHMIEEEKRNLTVEQENHDLRERIERLEMNSRVR